MIRCYKELRQLPTFLERYKYLRIGGIVGEKTFGSERYLNQRFYSSEEWKQIRREVILRDFGCDLGMPDREINGSIIVHHMNPITVDDIVEVRSEMIDPEFLICVSYDTHKAIHYGDERLLVLMPKERRPNDMCPWR